MNAFENTRDGMRQFPNRQNSRDLIVDAREEKVTASEFEGDAEPSQILHGINNMLVSILLNAQVIEWKLPSYSRIRRNVHEVERSAQRGAVLLSRLKHWVESGKAGDAVNAASTKERMTVRDETCEYCEQHGAAKAAAPESVD
jgi:hypothetical protein